MSESQLARKSADFDDKKYVYVKSFLVEPLLAITYRCALMKSAIGDSRAPGRPEYMAIP